MKPYLSEALQEATRLITLCDVSPPRGSLGPEDLSALAPLAQADYVCCAYLPGRAVRLPSEVLAAQLEQHLGVGGVFNLATRDCNRLALSARLLGAATLGLRNGVVVHGDELTDKDLARGLRAVRDTRPTQLLEVAAQMAQGKDFRGLNLSRPLELCMGATIDLSRELLGEIRLTARKIAAGARFLLTQTIFDPYLPVRFPAAFQEITGGALSVPVIWGVPILSKDGMVLGELPTAWKTDLEAGRPGEDIALEFVEQMRQYKSVRGLYVVAPILKGGARDYASVGRFLERLR